MTLTITVNDETPSKFDTFKFERLQKHYGDMGFDDIKKTLSEQSKIYSQLPWSDPAKSRFYRETASLLEYLKLTKIMVPELSDDHFFMTKIRFSYVYDFSSEVKGDVLGCDLVETETWVYFQLDGSEPGSTEHILAMKKQVASELKKKLKLAYFPPRFLEKIDFEILN